MKASKSSQNRRRPKKQGESAPRQAISLDALAKRLASLERVPPALSAPAPPAVAAPVTLATAPAAGTLEQVGREADMAWSGVKRIMALLNVENKHVYYNSAGGSVSQAGSVLDLTALISQGVGGSQRVGDSLKILRVRVKFLVSYNGSASQIQGFTAVLGHSKDSVPLVADVFAVVGTTSSGLAFPSDTYSQADKWSEAKTSYVSSTDVVKLLDFDVKFGHDVLYTNGTTTSASGAVWFGFISNEPSNFPSYSIAVDVEFVDN